MWWRSRLRGSEFSETLWLGLTEQQLNHRHQIGYVKWPPDKVHSGLRKEAPRLRVHGFRGYKEEALEATGRQTFNHGAEAVCGQSRQVLITNDHVKRAGLQQRQCLTLRFRKEYRRTISRQHVE